MGCETNTGLSMEHAGGQRCLIPIIPTANGQQRGNLGMYTLEKSEGFCIPAGGTWDNPAGGAGFP